MQKIVTSSSHGACTFDSSSSSTAARHRIRPLPHDCSSLIKSYWMLHLHDWDVLGPGTEDLLKLPQVRWSWSALSSPQHRYGGYTWMIYCEVARRFVVLVSDTRCWLCMPLKSCKCTLLWLSASQWHGWLRIISDEMGVSCSQLNFPLYVNSRTSAKHRQADWRKHNMLWNSEEFHITKHACFKPCGNIT